MEDVRIVIKGYINREMTEWFNLTSVNRDIDGNTSVCAIVEDQAELFGILNLFKNLGIKILKFESFEKERDEPEGDFL